MDSKIDFFEDFKGGQKAFGENIAAIINSILLTVVFFIGVGSTSIIAKIFNKHFLSLETDEKAKTYWEKLNLKTESVDKHYRQF